MEIIMKKERLIQNFAPKGTYSLELVEDKEISETRVLIPALDFNNITVCCEKFGLQNIGYVKIPMVPYKKIDGKDQYLCEIIQSVKEKIKVIQ